MVLEELQYSEHNIIHVAKSGRLALLGMMQAASPINGNVAVAMVELDGAPHGTSSVGLAKIIQTIKHGAIFANVETLQLPHLVVLRLWRDLLQERHVVIRMETTQVAIASGLRPQQLHS